MDRIVASAPVFAPESVVFSHVRDFRNFPKYSSFLESVSVDGTSERYEFVLSWWKIDLTATSEVISVDEPNVIHWRTVEGLDLEGYWRIEPEADASSADDSTACRLYFEVEYGGTRPNSITDQLPRLVPFRAIKRRAVRTAVEEISTVLSGIVVDLEGERRDVAITLHERPEA